MRDLYIEHERMIFNDDDVLYLYSNNNYIFTYIRTSMYTCTKHISKTFLPFDLTFNS